MRIEQREIGESFPVLVIAEIGVNHDGSAERALELVQHSKDAGADVVKLQVFTGEHLMHKSARFAEYQKDRVTASDPVGMLRQYELNDNALADIVKEIRQLGMIPMATPFSMEDVDRIVRLGIPVLKIASPDLVNHVLLTACLETHLPMILSTGASTLDEIANSVEWLCARNAQFMLLHCISSYPVQIFDAQLNWISLLNKRFDRKIGYSDHTTEAIAGALAVVAGACVIEKHLTYDTRASGPDHSASLDPVGFAEYVRLIRQAEQMRGHGDRRVLDCEKDVRDVSRQSLVIRTGVHQGQKFTVDNLICQRPCNGIGAWQLEQVIGKCSTRALESGTMLMPDMVEGW